MDYKKPAIFPIDYDFDKAPQLGQTDAYMTLARKDVLGIVQSAFEELGMHPDLIAIKREVLDEVVKGRLSHALRAAIIGAGQARSD